MRPTAFMRARLAERIESRTLAWYVIGIIALLVMLGWGLSRLAPPAPPRRVIMTTGTEDGAYHRYALRYRELLARHGVELVLLPSSGAAQNLERLRTGEGGVEVGLVQGGLVRDADADQLVTLGSLFFEPIWIFYRSREPIDHISELRGQRLAIGIPGSGTHALGMAVARDNGLAEAPTSLAEVGGIAAADALVEGGVDAALFVAAIDAPAVQRLLRTRGVRLMDARRADSYVRRLPYLHKVQLPEGVVDLKADIPPQQMTMIAVTGNLVAREGLHPVAVELLLDAARKVHGGPTLLHGAGEFPAAIDVELPLDSDADRFYKERPSLLRRVLPFWAAVWAERLLFILLPLLAIAVPAFAYLPKIYDWRIRSKLDGWYAEVNLIERSALDRGDDPESQLARINDIDERLNRVRVPKTYLSKLYTLRGHVDYVRAQLVARTGKPPIG